MVTELYTETDDYLEEELPGRPLRQRIGKSTVVLFTLALIAGAFFAGVVVEKGQAKSSSTPSLASLAARFRAAAGAAGAGGGAISLFGGGGGGVTGTVTLVDGNDVYITQRDGSIIKAVTSPSSQVTVTNAGTVQSLHPGDNVTVTGPSDSNGDVTATSIQDNGASGAGGGRRGGGGGGASGNAPSGNRAVTPTPGGD